MQEEAMALVLDQLIKAIRSSAVYNSEVQAAPACILWPDKDRQWESVMHRLQKEMPELFALGSYAHERKSGPAIWLRCVLSETIPEYVRSEGQPFVFYLPGVSRLDLRAVESCPEYLKPLVELQYRGCIWSQGNAKDWTLYAWLKSEEGGLGLDVAKDSETKNALQIALNAFLDENIELLRGKRLDATYFNTLLTGGDPVRDLLQWMDQGDSFKKERSEEEWKAFNDVCKSNFVFSPEKNGVLTAAEKLAIHDGPWKSVWDRYCEAPSRYLFIPDLIKRCKKPDFGLFADEKTCGGWPQWNEDREGDLRKDLLSLENLPEYEARKKILALEKDHKGRRSLVWAELGMSPYVVALEGLSKIAEITSNSLAAGTENDIADGYRTFGWKADDALLKVLASANDPEVLNAATVAVKAIYYPWAEECARYLQSKWDLNDPRKKFRFSDSSEDCIVFIDGLRLDCAKRLAALLIGKGFSVFETARWAPLPSVTGTGKPAVAPLLAQASIISEDPPGYNFEILNTSQLRKIIRDNGYEILLNNGAEVPNRKDVRKLWIECGDIDHEGHSHGCKMARQINSILDELAGLIESLLLKGWNTIKIVTDHGWLLIPGGLNKIELPAALSESKWGRCASLKEGAVSEERLFPWYWNQSQYFALANGTSCFKAGEEYTHGGLSVQEALVLDLTVSTVDAHGKGASLTVTDIDWKGLRCNVIIDGATDGITADIRTDAGSETSSVAVSPKKFKDNGTVSLVVENEELEGTKVFFVCTNADGNLLAQTETVIGGTTR